LRALPPWTRHPCPRPGPGALDDAHAAISAQLLLCANIRLLGGHLLGTVVLMHDGLFLHASRYGGAYRLWGGGSPSPVWVSACRAAECAEGFGSPIRVYVVVHCASRWSFPVAPGEVTPCWMDCGGSYLSSFGGRVYGELTLPSPSDFGWGTAGGTARSAVWQVAWLAGGATAPIPPLPFPLHRALFEEAAPADKWLFCTG
jgi:hypothetical protein